MPPKGKPNYGYKKGKLARQKEKRKGAHDAGGRKKQKSTWIPATQRQRKAAKLREAIRPHQGRSRNKFLMELRSRWDRTMRAKTCLSRRTISRTIRL